MGEEKDTPSDCGEKLQMTNNTLPSTAKYTCIGTAQLVSRPVVTSSNDSTLSTVKANSTKLTQTFVLKKVSKDSKTYKLPNTNYKIKPVCKDVRIKNLRCPVVYMGAPFATNPGDCLDLNTKVNGGAPVAQRHTSESESTLTETEISKADLYSISSLKDTFIPTCCNGSEPAAVTYATNGLKTEIFTSTDAPPESSRKESIKLGTTDLVQMVARTIPNVNGAWSVAKCIASLSDVAAPLASLSDTCQKSLVVSKSGQQSSTSKKQSSKPSVVLKSAGVCSIGNQTSVSSSLVLGKPIAIFKTSNAQSDTLKVKFIPASSAARSSKILQVCPRRSVDSSVIQIHRPSHPVTAISVIPTAVCSISTVCTVTSLSKSKMPKSDKMVQAFIVSTPAPDEKYGKISKSKNVSVTAADGSKISKATQRVEKVSDLKDSGTDCNKDAMQKEDIRSLKRNLDECDAYLSNKLSKRSRVGVEIEFADGVKHFVGHLNQMTYLDDEPIKSWQDLKKGTKVAALWKDGLVYDAVVVTCYLPPEKQLRPVVEIEKLNNKNQNENPKAKSKSKTSKIVCSSCKSVFSKIGIFRKHQRLKCRSQGITVFSDNDQKSSNVGDGQQLDGSDAPENSKTSGMNRGSTYAKKNINTAKIPLTDGEHFVPPVSPSGKLLFRNGTKFLHHWQLQDGSSKWYHGEVLRAISASCDQDCEFEVLYKGEEEQGPYVVKLYEDYPADIRIMGHS